MPELEATVQASRQTKGRSRSSRLQTAAWAMVGAAAALATAAGIMALKMQDSADQMHRLAIMVDPYTETRLPYEGAYRDDFERYERQGRLYEALAWTFVGLTGAAVAAAVTLFALDHLRTSRLRKRVRVQLGAGPRAGAVTLQLDF